MKVSVSININQNTINKVEALPDKVMYAIARQTLDMTGSTKATAYKTGKTERSMYSNGVQQDSQGYYIGNFTNYASRVYALENANWTNPNTKPHWFDFTWKRYGQTITNDCVRRYKV